MDMVALSPIHFASPRLLPSAASALLTHVVSTDHGWLPRGSGVLIRSIERIGAPYRRAQPVDLVALI
jgi:hypothetical protein